MPRLQAAMSDVVEAARRKGFRFTEPTLRQTKPELDMLMPIQVWYILAMTYHGPNVTIVNRWWADRLDDQMLHALLGHELGHIIDRQNQRTGHPSLDVLPKNGASEVVADVISIEIWDYDSQRALEQRTREEVVKVFATR